MPSKKIIVEEAKNSRPKKTIGTKKKKENIVVSKKEDASLDLRQGPAPLKIDMEELTDGAEPVLSVKKNKQEKDKKIEVNTVSGSFMEKLKRAGLEENKNDLIMPGEPMAEKIKMPISPSKLRLYKKIAISFISLTVVLLLVVAYFLLVKTTITLIPNQERTANNLIIDVFDSESGQTASGTAIAGKVDETIVTDEKTFPATGEDVLGEKLNGQVIIYNNYIKNQPLVATTRLQAPDGKIYRIKDTVNVPAGGSVAVEIYADDQNSDLTMGPTKFTLPGLWAGIQDKIYAEAKDGLKKEQQVKKVVKQSDIDNGINTLKEALTAKVKSEVGVKYSAYNQVIYNIDNSSISTEASGQAGDEKDEIKIKISAKVSITAFNEDSVIKLAGEKLSSSLPANKALLEISKKNITYSVNNFDYIQKKSSLNVTFEGVMVLKKDAEIVDRKALVGLSKTELEGFLNKLTDIAGYEIKFSPSFIKRTPYLVDRIKVEIKE